ncbi:Glyoxalase/bleomycin resistance protein/dioxygenase [Raoultella ornithinolytica]|nr:Glyoxalase/bleomycin resistance protein/dioxygenase [Raoultella ornithinolytica]
MTKDFTDIAVLFVAGFGPITQNTTLSHAFYGETLGLPLKRMAGNDDYLLTEQDAAGGSETFCPLAAGPGGVLLLLAMKSGRQICPFPRRGLNLKCAIFRPPPTC